MTKTKDEVIEGEPRKGKLFIIKGEKPKHGYRLCSFQERKGVGCQLHGDLIAYEYIFKVAPDFDIYQRVTVRVENERETIEQKRARWSKLYSRAVPYEAADHDSLVEEVERLREVLTETSAALQVCMNMIENPEGGSPLAKLLFMETNKRIVEAADALTRIGETKEES